MEWYISKFHGVTFNAELNPCSIPNDINDSKKTQNSSCKELVLRVGSAKAKIKLSLESLKIQPQPLAWESKEPS